MACNDTMIRKSISECSKGGVVSPALSTCSTDVPDDEYQYEEVIINKPGGKRISAKAAARRRRIAEIQEECDTRCEATEWPKQLPNSELQHTQQLEPAEEPAPHVHKAEQRLCEPQQTETETEPAIQRAPAASRSSMVSIALAIVCFVWIAIVAFIVALIITLTGSRVILWFVLGYLSVWLSVMALTGSARSVTKVTEIQDSNAVNSVMQ